MDLLGFFCIFFLFFLFYFYFFFIFVCIYFFFFKLLSVLLKVTEVTTEHKKWPKVSKNSIKSSFFAQTAKKASAGGRSPPQELEVKPA